MSMTGISNSYNNYVTQNTNDTTKKNVAKSNSRQVEFKEFNSEIKEPKLSTVAKNVLDEIRKTYGDMDIMVYEDGKDAKELLSRSTKEFTVMFSAEELEKMASGEKYKKQQINGIQGAVRMSEAINEKYGYERAFGKQNNDVAISKIAISFNEDGSTTMFAELEKMSKQQRDHIEAAREKRAEEKKSVEKKAAQKEQEPVKRTIVSASSMDELIAKWTSASTPDAISSHLRLCGFYSNGGFFTFTSSLPKANVVDELVGSAVQTLLAFSGTPNFNAVFNKPLNQKRSFILFAP